MSSSVQFAECIAVLEKIERLTHHVHLSKTINMAVESTKIKTWCNNNIGPRYDCWTWAWYENNRSWHFLNEDDALLFRLTWDQ